MATWRRIADATSSGWVALARRLDEAQVHLARIRGIEPNCHIENRRTARRIAPEGADRFREGARLLSAA